MCLSLSASFALGQRESKRKFSLHPSSQVDLLALCFCKSGKCSVLQTLGTITVSLPSFLYSNFCLIHLAPHFLLQKLYCSHMPGTLCFSPVCFWFFYICFTLVFVCSFVVCNAPIGLPTMVLLFLCFCFLFFDL